MVRTICIYIIWLSVFYYSVILVKVPFCLREWSTPARHLCIWPSKTFLQGACLLSCFGGSHAVFVDSISHFWWHSLSRTSKNRWIFSFSFASLFSLPMEEHFLILCLNNVSPSNSKQDQGRKNKKRFQPGLLYSTRTNTQLCSVQQSKLRICLCKSLPRSYALCPGIAQITANIAH